MRNFPAINNAKIFKFAELQAKYRSINLSHDTVRRGTDSGLFYCEGGWTKNGTEEKDYTISAFQISFAGIIQQECSLAIIKNALRR